MRMKYFGCFILVGYVKVTWMQKKSRKVRTFKNLFTECALKIEVSVEKLKKDKVLINLIILQNNSTINIYKRI